MTELLNGQRWSVSDEAQVKSLKIENWKRKTQEEEQEKKDEQEDDYVRWKTTTTAAYTCRRTTLTALVQAIE